MKAEMSKMIHIKNTPVIMLRTISAEAVKFDLTV